MTKIGRNDPCPCSSGKKYKTCCLRKGQIRLRQINRSAGSFTPAERASAIKKLMHFASGLEFDPDREIATTLFCGSSLEGRSDEDIQMVMELEQTEINFNSWFLFDMDLDDGKTVADFFLAREGDRLTPGERAYLEKVSRTHFRLYEVEDVQRDRGFRLKDLWTGETCQVKERTATHYFVRWDLMATRLMDVGGDDCVIDAGIYNYPPDAKEAILTGLRREHRRFRRNLPGQDDTAFFKRVGILFNQWWLDWVVFRPLPRVVTAEGDEMVFAKVLFDMEDEAKVTSALQRSPEFDREEERTYVWIQKTRDFTRGLATVKMREHRLILETTSKERGHRGRQLLEELAGEALRYRLTEYQDLKQALKSRVEKRLSSDLPAEMEARLKKDVLDTHYQKWLDEKISALSYRTPRHAVKLKTLRPKLVDLLKEIENAEARAASGGQIPYDFGWLWKELGLKREP